jgi:hypothetical protein
VSFSGVPDDRLVRGVTAIGHCAPSGVTTSVPIAEGPVWALAAMAGTLSSGQ